MITFPESTLVGKTVPKTAFYKNLEVNARMKQRFVDDVASVTWVAQTKEQEALQQKTAVLEAKIAKERQPKKKFELHQQLVKLKENNE